MSNSHQDNPNGSTCVVSVSGKESPVYLRNFGNVLYLVDASGKPLGMQEAVDVGRFAVDEIQRVTVTVAHQGFWHEGLAQGSNESLAKGMQDGLHCCSQSREAFWAVAAAPGMLASGQLERFVVDPLEQAIDQTVRLLPETEGELAVRLSRHLNILLAEQVKRALGA